MAGHFPFEKAPLEFNYIELMPYLDPDTIYLHYDKIYNNQVDILNYLLSPYPQYHGWSLEQLFSNKLQLPTVMERNIKNFAGSVFNHERFFEGLCGDSTGTPDGKLGEEILFSYGSMNNFQNLFRDAANNILGSGWVWLVTEKNGPLHIVITENNQVPDLRNFIPLITADTWEHAYYLRYPAQPGKYLENWFKVLNWKKAEQRYADAVQKPQAKLGL